MGVVMISHTGEVTKFPFKENSQQGNRATKHDGKIQTGRDSQTPLGHLSFVGQGSGLAGMVD